MALPILPELLGLLFQPPALHLLLPQWFLVAVLVLRVGLIVRLMLQVRVELYAPMINVIPNSITSKSPPTPRPMKLTPMGVVQYDHA